MKALKSNGKFLLLVALMVISVVLSACATPAATDAPTDEPTAAPTEAATEAGGEATEAVESPLPTVLTMPEEIAGGRPVEITVSEMPAEAQPVLRQQWLDQVARFEAKYPNVKITGDTYTYAVDTFPPLVAAGQVPTLFECYLTDPSKMIEQGIATDLTSYYQAAGADKVINPNILSIVSSDDGKIYGIPRFAYAMGLAYNKEMLTAAGFDAPPTSWDQALEMATKLTDRDKGVAGLSMITDGTGATGWHLTTIAYTYGLQQDDIVVPDGDTYTSTLDNEAMLNSLNLIHDLRWTGDVLPLENPSWPTNGEALATEHAAMVVMAGQQFIWIRQTYPDAPIEKFAFAPLPAGPDGQSSSLIGGNVAMISASATDDQKEAAFYYRIWTQLDPAENQINLENGAKDPAVVIGAPNLPLYVGEFQTALKALEEQYANVPTENYADFLAAVEDGSLRIVPEPKVAGQEYYGIVGTLVSEIVTNEALDIAAGLKAAQENYQNNVLNLLTK
jgi:ABC-type glycerol-3-phosphate transport system substrate-binding protein